MRWSGLGFDWERLTAQFRHRLKVASICLRLLSPGSKDGSFGYTAKLGGSLYGLRDRLLTRAEENLIRKVFENATLPRMSQIFIRDGLSPTGTPITIRMLRTPLDGPISSLI